MKRKTEVSLFLLIGFLLFSPVLLFSQKISIVPRQDYYTTEKTAEILFYLNGINTTASFTGKIFDNKKLLATESGLHSGMNRVPLELSGFKKGKNPLRCLLMDSTGKTLQDTMIMLTVLPPKFNETKTDRLTGTLMVHGLPFIPFGFYAYSPVFPTLPEEEAVKGFNMMSPYQKITKKTLKQRKAYMDRCAALGMKVNYNLLSVAGGGGVGSKMDLASEKKRKLLIREINTFKDHPALLSWYIADEPVGQGKPPEPIAETYKLIKKLDPYHPVTVVFMTPSQAWRYAGTMDIVMADPYPIPNAPVTTVEKVSKLLENSFYPAKPLWIVPQAFGGAENWKREPTPGEIRVMTYLALINGARGIQYFIRNGLNGFPKSTETWNECSKIALETAELTPYYAQGKTIAGITTDNDSIRLKAFAKDSTLVVICVNTAHQPKLLTIHFTDTLPGRQAEVLFENRSVSTTAHQLTDIMDGLGTRIYKLSLKEVRKHQPQQTANMMVDPGFEYLPVPGVPSACYAHVGNDRGATYFVDSRVSHSGEHALRLVTPTEGKGVSLYFFPAYLEYNHTYRYAVWAKAAPSENLWKEKSFFWRWFHHKPLPPSFTVGAKGAGTKTFILTNKWKRYDWFLTPADSTKRFQRTSLTLELNSRGTAWFDDMDLEPVLTLKTRIPKPGRNIEINLLTNIDSTDIRYNLQGNKPGLSSPLYTKPFLLLHDARLVAGLFRNGKRLGTFSQSLVIHKALGKKLILKTPFSDRYNGGGTGGLTDGLLAEASYRDPHWQGFLKNDLVATVDLDSIQTVQEIKADFLQQIRWFRIFFPTEVSYYVSQNGKDFTRIYHFVPQTPSRENGPVISTVSWKGKPVKARFVRMVAKNRGVSPAWSSGTGLKTWIFCDELVVK